MSSHHTRRSMQWLLVLVLSVSAAPALRAAAVARMDVTIDWSSLVITGPLTLPFAVSVPEIGLVDATSDADAFVFDQTGDLQTDQALNGTAVTATHVTPVHELRASYDPAADLATGMVRVTNHGPGNQQGGAGAWHSLFYQATGTGPVTIDVAYSLNGAVSTDTVLETATAGHELTFEAIDGSLFSDRFYAELAANGGDVAQAQQTAGLVSLLDLYTDNIWNLIDCSGSAPCSHTTMTGGTISLSFDVVAGNVYNFGGEGVAVADTSVVPLPAAVWFFVSGVLGLGFIARQRSPA